MTYARYARAMRAGVKYVPRRIFEARAGQPLPKGAVVVNPQALQ